MAQIEQNFSKFLSKNPEIESCYQKGLINRRALARYLVHQGVAGPSRFEAVVAMLRRFPFREFARGSEVFRGTRVYIKDSITILDFEKEKGLVQELEKLIKATDYDKGDTLKIVVGSSCVKVFIDSENEHIVEGLTNKYLLRKRLADISEISVKFSEKAADEKGILSTITRQFAMHGIVVSEFLTATPELLIYLKEEYVLKAYEILKFTST